MSKYEPISTIKALVPLLNQPIEEIEPRLWFQYRQALEPFYPGAEKPKISIVLIGRNEERFLFPSLASISGLKCSESVELILVNNGSDDRSQEIADRLGVFSVYEPKAGWAEARQAGLEKARGDLILSADGDNLYPSTWCKALAEPLLKDPSIQVSCGQYCFFTYDNKYPLGIQLYQSIRFFNSWSRSFRLAHINAMGGNMAFRRKEALAIGGYKMGVGRGEDGDLAFRLQQKGKIKFLAQKEAFAYSSLRHVITEGTLMKTLFSKFWLHLKRIPEYLGIS